MSELQRLMIEENGQIVEIYVETPQIADIPEPTNTGKRSGAKGGTDDVLLKMEEVQSKIQAYANFAIGAFKHLGGAEVEEISLKFGIKLGGKTGIIFTEGSMEISVKCKFSKEPDKKESSDASSSKLPASKG